MKLTPYQRRHLEALESFRVRKPNVWRLIMFRPASLIPFVAIAILSAALYLFVDERAGLFVIGMSFGAILRIVAHARFAVLAWPVTEAVTDWSKVARLRSEADGGDPS